MSGVRCQCQCQEDPAGLLSGIGKRHRHVKIRSVADAARPELRELLLPALAAKGR